MKNPNLYDLEAEKGIIASILTDSDVLNDVIDILSPNDFSEVYKPFWETIEHIANAGKRVDFITVHNEMVTSGTSKEITMDYLRDIADSVAVSTNIKEYADIVRQKATNRLLIEKMEKLTLECQKGSDGADRLVEQEIMKLIEQRSMAQDFTPISEIASNVIRQIEDAHKRKGQIGGLSTGFADLDRMIDGLHPSDLILVAARPAMGKTAFALNIASEVCIKNSNKAVIFSLEMSKEQLVTRLVSSDAMIESGKLRTGDLVNEDWDGIIMATDNISKSGLIIDDTCNSLSEIRSRSRTYKKKYDIKMIMIDYLQLMTGSSRESRQQEISEISRGLKMLAKELNVPIVALSQLSRAVESRADHKPMMADLRESGAIEQDADCILMLYREEYYKPDTENKNIGEVIIAKQRNGSTGTVELVWLGQYTKFANKERIEPFTNKPIENSF